MIGRMLGVKKRGRLCHEDTNHTLSDATMAQSLEHSINALYKPLLREEVPVQNPSPFSACRRLLKRAAAAYCTRTYDVNEKKLDSGMATMFPS